jgi:hypothetical protein
MKSFNTQYPKALKNGAQINETFKYINQNFSAYLLAYGTLNIADSKISGPRVGLCSTDVVLDASTLDSTGKGCQADKG